MQRTVEPLRVRFTIKRLAYAQVPNSLVLAVRNDGVLLGLTYLKEQEVFAWHHHDTQGLFEDLAVMTATNEDVAYFIVNRTLNGSTVRCIEKWDSRQFTDVRDAPFLDCALVYDGRNTGSTTMTLTGGSSPTTAWDENSTVTITASAAFFNTTPHTNPAWADVGDSIQFIDADGMPTRLLIQSVTSSTVAVAQPDRIVGADLRGVAVLTWARGVAAVSGLDLLDNMAVGVYADGAVIGSPNNPAFTTVYTVASGALTLDKPYGVIRVGLPYLSDLQTLPLDLYQGDSILGQQKVIGELQLYVQNTRGVWFGGEPPEVAPDYNPAAPDATVGLVEMKVAEYSQWGPAEEQTGVVPNLPLKTEYRRDGEVFIRIIDPVPATIDAIIPSAILAGQ